MRRPALCANQTTGPPLHRQADQPSGGGPADGELARWQNLALIWHLVHDKDGYLKYVRDAVREENVELPSGRIEGAEVELAVRTLGRLNTPEAFENLIVKEEGGRVVRFRDVGEGSRQIEIVPSGSDDLTPHSDA